MIPQKSRYVLLFSLAVLFYNDSIAQKGELSAALKEKYESVDVLYFTSMDDALKKPDEVYKLKLSGKQLTAVPSGISKFKNLVALDLSNNQITEASAEVFNLTNLIELNLGNNKLTSVPSQICSLKNLENLYLNGNNITGIGSELSCLPDLQKLFLQNNQITSLSSDIGNLKNLKYLYLFGNSIEKIPDELYNLSKLQVLLLNNNKFASPSQGFEKLRYLKYYSDDSHSLNSSVYENGTTGAISPNETTASGRTSKNYSKGKRKPLLAFGLSYVLPGAGQYYNHQYAKGVVMTLGCATGLVLALALPQDETRTAYTSGGKVYYRYDYSISTGAILAIIGGGAFWLWNVIDAPVSASRINKRNGMNRWAQNNLFENDKFGLNLAPYTDFVFANTKQTTFRSTAIAGAKLTVHIK